MNPINQELFLGVVLVTMVVLMTAVVMVIAFLLMMMFLLIILIIVLLLLLLLFALVKHTFFPRNHPSAFCCYDRGYSGSKQLN